MEKETREIDSIIDKAFGALGAAIEGLGKSMTVFITTYFVTNWILKDGNIEDRPENYETINNLNIAKATFFTESVAPFLAGIARVLWKIKGASQKYFEAAQESVGETLPESIIQTMTDTIKKTFGFDVDDAGTVIMDPNGWLVNLGQMDDIYLKIRELAMQAVSKGMSFKDFQAFLKNYIEGDPTITGLMRAHFRTISNDVYTQYYRMVAYKNAILLGYQTAIYQGGLVPTSRPFCIERDGKVFTFDEIQQFGTQADKFEGYSNKPEGKFEGKPSVGYDPFWNQGGYNCRHFWSFIPDKYAIHLRPELKDILNARKN